MPALRARLAQTNLLKDRVFQHKGHREPQRMHKRGSDDIAPQAVFQSGCVEIHEET